MEPQHKSQLKSIVLNLRHILEGHHDSAGGWHPGDLEERMAGLGVRRGREAVPLEELQHLSEDDLRARQILDAFVQSSVNTGRTREEAIHTFLKESAYTWANRLMALRCMEARGLIDEVILQKTSYGGRSLKHYRLARQNPATCAGEDDGLYAVLFAEFAERKPELPLLFDPDEPVVSLRPGMAGLKKCLQLLSAPDEIFTASDTLGWAYQYWNTEEKDRVFTRVRTVKGAKIERGDIIPVTQLYTEPYMVKFLVQNSLGALWMAMHPDSRLCERWAYYVREVDRSPVEPRPLKSISFLDPCVGSGHFHLEAFDLLYAMYAEEGDLTSPAEICEAILSHSLYGIDIDERAIQIAALALYMKAKEKAPNFRPKRINLVATNIHPANEKDHLEAFLARHPEDRPLQNALRLIFESLQNVNELGTLLQIEEPVEKEIRFLKGLDDERKAHPPKPAFLFPEMRLPEQQALPLGAVSYEEWKADLLSRLKTHFEEDFVSPDFSARFFGETAEKGLSLFDFLSRRYDVVATNPPYMGSKNMGPVVKRYVERHFAPGKRDLYAAFILRCIELARPDTGRVAMVSQQSWMFLRSFADLRALDEEKLQTATGFKGILRETSIETLAHLGPRAFGEISGEVVNIVLFTLAKTPPRVDHRLTAFRLIGPKSPAEKDALLRNGANTPVSRPKQARFLSIPQTPICYWLREKFFELLAGRTLGDVAEVCQGLATANDPRFVRFVWEAPIGEWALPVRNRRWVPFEKGGGYGKWFGHHFWVVDWEHGGARIKAFPASVVRNEQHYFKEGWTYSYMARGSLGVRKLLPDTIFSHLSSAVFFLERGPIAPILNTRISSRTVRSLSAKIQLNESYVCRIPIAETCAKSGSPSETACVALKRYIVGLDPTERAFAGTPSQTSISQSTSGPALGQPEAIAAVLHTLEGASEHEVFTAYGIDGEDLQSVLDETGTPAGWFPLIKGYDALPPLPTTLGLDAEGGLEQGLLPPDHTRLSLAPADLDALKFRLRSLYEAGPGAREVVDVEETDATADEDDENEQIAIGARIPIPAETFLEELAQKLEIHPISVYWLLKEGSEKEGWRCLPEEQRLTRDRYTVLILRLLGHRWPKQIEAGEPVPDWADEDGIIPLSEGTEELTLYRRLRDRLAAEYGNEQVSAEETAFEEVMGKPLQEWVRKDFFRQHISRFRKRPIAWHVSSAQWTGRPRQEAAFECLVYYHKVDGDLLPKIRSHYVGPLLKRISLELKALEDGKNGDLTGDSETRKALNERIGELKAFDSTLSELIAGGFGPKDMASPLRQYAINDAMLCLKARWLKRLSSVIQARPLAEWLRQVEETGLHPDYAAWVSDAMTHLDRHCAVVGLKPPEEKTLNADPGAGELTEMICAGADTLMKDALKRGCDAWWKFFDTAVLKPIAEKIRDAKKDLKSLKERLLAVETPAHEKAKIKWNMAVLKSDIKVWQNEHALKAGQGHAVREVIEVWQYPEALTWKSWLAGQDLYDQVSSLNPKRTPPRTIQEFVRQESLYQPDINDGVRVNIAPLQKAGLLTADVLAAKDADKAIADRAAWRDDERRWCREGKLPQPGWWK